jgi:hypothetical protein
MEKIFLSLFITVSLLTLSAHGQRPVRRFCLQDDRTGAQLAFSADGAYQFTTCRSEIPVQGVGKVKIKGCLVTLTDVTNHQLIQAELNTCDSSGKASIRVDSCPSDGGDWSDTKDGPPRIEPICRPFFAIMADSNLRDSGCACL